MPRAGQFYMLAARRLGRADGRPVPAARVLGRRGRGGRRRASGSTSCSRRSARAPSGSPALERRRATCSSPARSAGRSRRRRELAPDAAGAILVGGGIGIAPLAILAPPARRARRAAARPARVSRPRPLGRARAVSLLGGAARVRGRPHAATRATSPTCSRSCSRATTRPAPPSTHAARRRCWRRCARCAPSASVAAELAMETPMACGFGSCFGCAVPLRGGGYMRLCVDGPVVNAARDRDGAGRGERALMSGPTCATSTLRASASRTRSSTARGTFDAIAARRAFGDAVAEQFPFSIFVSKTITPEPRAGNPPPRLYETPAGMINSIGLPNKGLEGFVAHDLPRARRLPVPLFVSVMATEPRRLRPPRRAGRRARGGRRDRAERLLPERQIGPDRRRAAGGDAGAVEALRPLTDEAADREADAERRRPGGRRGGGRGGRGGRGLADQHAEGERARPGDACGPGSAPGSGGLSGPAVRAVALDQVRRVADAVSIPGDRDGRDRERGRRAGVPRRRGRRGRGRHRELPRSARPASRVRASSPASSSRPRSGLDASAGAGLRAGVDLNLRSNRISPENAGTPLRLGPDAGIFAAADGPRPVDTLRRRPREVPRAADAGASAGERNPLGAAQLKRDLKGGQGEDRDSCCSTRPTTCCRRRPST